MLSDEEGEKLGYTNDNINNNSIIEKNKEKYKRESNAAIRCRP